MDLLTQKEVPALMFLLHSIEQKEEFKKAKNKPKLVAKMGSFEDYHYATTRTIRRAFKLFENLKAKEIIEKDYNIPCRKTLDVLAQYHSYYEGKIKTQKCHVFEYFQKHRKDDIDVYYVKFELSSEELNTILNKSLPKREQCKVTKEELISCKNLVSKLSVDGLNKFFVKSTNQSLSKELDYIQLKYNLLNHLNVGIKKSKNILFWYSIIGTLVFLFVSLPEYFDLKDYLIDFLDNFSNNSELNNDVVEKEETEKKLVISY